MLLHQFNKDVSDLATELWIVDVTFVSEHWDIWSQSGAKSLQEGSICVRVPEDASRDIGDRQSLGWDGNDHRPFGQV